MSKRDRTLVAAVLLGVAGLFVVMSNQRFYFLQGSAASDILLSRALASGQGFREVLRIGSPPCTVRPPGFTSLLAVLNLLFGENLFLYKLINNLFGAAAFLFGVLLLRKRTRSPAVPLMIAAFSMTLPFWIGIARHLYSGIIFTALVMSSLWVFEREHERGFTSVLSLIGFSVLASAALLTRSIGVTLPAAAVLSVFLHRRLPIKNRLYLAAAVLLITGLFFGAWTVRNYKVQGAKDEPYLSKLLVGEPLGSTYWLAEDQGIPLMPEPKKLTPARFAKRITDNGRYYLFHTAGFLVPALERLPAGVRAALSGSWFVLVMGGLGFMIVRQKRISEIYAALTLLVALAWPFPHPRFFAPALPVLLLAMTGSITWLSGKAAGHAGFAPVRGKARLAGIVAAALFILVNLGSDATLVKKRFKKPEYQLTRPGMTMVADRPYSYASLLVLDRLRKNAPPDARVMFHSVYPCALVTERVCAPVPMADPERLMRWVRENGIDYIIMDSEKGAFGASYFSYRYLWPAVQRYEGQTLELLKS
ncbi:MAG: hypothetical protein R6V10_13495, partial [bacterium]